MKITTLLLCLCVSVNAFAQNYDFGKVSIEELQEKFNPLDSSASATYLYKYRKTFFEYQQGEGFYLVTEIHERIKIYNQEGFNQATKTINLYKSDSNDEEVNGLKAYTYSLANGKIEDTKLKKDGIFKTEKSKYLNETKFTMPNIKEGSIIEYKYKIVSPFYQNVDEFQLQHAIPIKKLEAIFEAPEYFNFRVNTKGFLSVVPKNESKMDKITFNNKTRSGGGGFSTIQTTYSQNDIEFQKNIYTYSLKSIPALKDEPFVNNINNYRSSVKYELSYTKFPNSTLKYYSTTWEDVVKTIYKSSSFGDELDKYSYYKDDIDALISSVSDPSRRAALIFNFVKKNVKWNGYYGKYTDKGVRKAYKDQVGNIAEINLMLTSMLRYASINANPVLISTRSNGVPLFPTLDGYNYVVTYINFPEGSVLLDASNKYNMPNILPFRALNWQGRVIAKHGGSTLISLYPEESSRNTISMMAKLSETGGIKGSYRSMKTNHNALLYREKFNGADEEEFLEKLENKYNGMEISDFKVTNAYELEKPVMESYKFEIESQADIIGNKIYFSPMLFLKTSENPFKLKKREIPIDFGYPSSSMFRIMIDLPEGFKVESFPEPSHFALPNDLGEFKYNISVNQSSIQLLIETQINQAIVSPIYYDVLKEYFNTFIKKETDQVVLTRI